MEKMPDFRFFFLTSRVERRLYLDNSVEDISK